MKNGLDQYLKSGPNEAVKDLIRTYQAMVKHLGLDDEVFSGKGKSPEELHDTHEGSTVAYAMGNLSEYGAHVFRNPELQKLLGQIKDTDGRTMWQKVVDSVRRIIGLDAPHGTLLGPRYS